MNVALQFVVMIVAGWVNRKQQDVIDYLVEENRVLREHLGKRRLRLTDAQRRRLASKGRVVGRKALAAFVGIVAPDTILRWYRELVGRKYDGSLVGFDLGHVDPVFAFDGPTGERIVARRQRPDAVGDHLPTHLDM